MIWGRMSMSDPRKRRIRYTVRIRASSAEQKASSEVSRSIVLLSHLLGDGVLNGRLQHESELLGEICGKRALDQGCDRF
jgi:hypothetical protein